MVAFGFGFSLGVRQRRLRAAGAVFDFAGGVLPAGASLSRASIGTRYDAAGALASAAVDASRFDYDPITLGLRGLLVETAATNALAQSNDVSSAGWTKQSGFVALSAVRIRESAGTVRGYLTQNLAFTAGQTVCVSVIVSEVAGSPKRYAQLVLTSAVAGSNKQATFDLSAGAFVKSANCTAGMASLGAGKWLIWLSVTITITATGGGVLQIGMNSSNSGSIGAYVNDAAAMMDLSELQVEEGALPSTRIRTIAASASRSPDILMLAGPSGTYRFTFDDLTTQDVSLVSSAGVVTVPTILPRTRLRKAEYLPA